MKAVHLLCVGAFALLLVSSCSSLRVGTAVKASYQAEQSALKEAADESDPDEGWAMRYVPGLKTVARIIPPPTEGRKKFDEEMNRKYRQWTDEFSRH